MISLVYPGVDKNDYNNTEDGEAEEGEDGEAEGEEAEAEEAEGEEAEAEEAEETEEAEEAEDGEAELDTDLSLKQREHGAVKSKSLSEEDDTVLYKKLYEIVQETQRRNEARSRALTRTPTSSSLAAPVDSEDEYADMPPLIHANSVLRYRANTSDDSIVNSNRIPTIREILEGYNTMDEVD